MYMVKVSQALHGEDKEEIVDETDVYIDVHKRIRIAAATAASFVSRAPSARRLIVQRSTLTCHSDYFCADYFYKGVKEDKDKSPQQLHN
ncbi:hypothetical protein CTI12_AA612210 [Artemisia annua]|uniref:Uncharacterized protein n=1 Tax=Artemisia annua TaxID=35608 RepID=A0A2U1KEX6_ARTAN|nr:hypothetical protein CTI12_AA612210 [Artemisia annua]